MFEFTVTPPKVFLLFLAAIALIVVFSMVLKRGGTGRKIAAFVIVLVVLGIVAFIFYRPTVVSVDDRGFAVKRFRQRSVSWSDVSRAEWIADLPESEYRPKARIVGVGLGQYRIGTFRLKNGQTAQVVTEQDREALLIATAEQQYLFALSENEKLIDAVAGYIDLQRE